MKFKRAEPEPGWEVLREETHFSSPHLEVVTCEVRSPGRGEPREWTVARRKAAAVVAPLTADGRLMLVRQERVPVRRTIWEFPAGQIDCAGAPDESAARETALRELREESGWRLAEGGSLRSIGYFYPSSGFTDEVSYLFCAQPVVPDERGTEHDAHEVIAGAHSFSVLEFRAMAGRGEICDANTLCAFARMTVLGLLPPDQEG